MSVMKHKARGRTFEMVKLHRYNVVENSNRGTLQHVTATGVTQQAAAR